MHSFDELMEHVNVLKARRQRYLMVNLVGVFVLLTLQLVLIFTNALPSSVMIYYPFLLLAWGAFFIYKSFSFGKQINDLFEFYRSSEPKAPTSGTPEATCQASDRRERDGR